MSGQGKWDVLEELTGQELADRNFSYRGPFDELPAQQNARTSHLLILWKDVTEEEGTGIVHIAPGCGNEDFQLGKEYGLPAIAPIDEAGCFVGGFDWMTGQHASDVAPQVAQNLREKELLYSSEQYVHSYGHCWRCGTELLFRLVDEKEEGRIIQKRCQICQINSFKNRNGLFFKIHDIYAVHYYRYSK